MGNSHDHDRYQINLHVHEYHSWGQSDLVAYLPLFITN